ncbi:MAG TPA: type II toxin-antitoxin system VapC family toxin [Acidimicrobiales bacterium]|nr:type II toxin-antitoxin system VapC family toxin [Acidimicrobiales bacterium]
MKGQIIYLDTSGAMKLVRPEAHSHDLSGWFRERPGMPVLSSVLIEVELVRATRRSAQERIGQAADVLRSIGVVTVSPSVITRAAAYPDPDLRSLDAIHLATAEHVVSVTHGALEAFVAYDERLVAAARHMGLPVVAPGVT